LEGSNTEEEKKEGDSIAWLGYGPCLAEREKDKATIGNRKE